MLSCAETISHVQYLRQISTMSSTSPGLHGLQWRDETQSLHARPFISQPAAQSIDKSSIAAQQYRVHQRHVILLLLVLVSLFVLTLTVPPLHAAATWSLVSCCCCNICSSLLSSLRSLTTMTPTIRYATFQASMHRMASTHATSTTTACAAQLAPFVWIHHCA